MTVKKNIDLEKPLTNKQLKMLDEMKNSPVVYDEDCPELTPEELKQFRRVADIKREERLKQTVSLRLSPQAVKKAKSLGKGYTSVLSRILEAALNDNELISKYL
ncbi:MAG: BrnA antitoxin family protein [Lachnospiraceae bacterium]|nr:BrnA antitoxin family protein [Lachnospiraceae bacterium]